ncbi:helix-turn-helix transcriptional regulator [Haladaptatus caseinilyticus]|uniref:helix-turn-helix transcriptional regulator n=1 Tax=Haladaptatus caseinilyticus TaxID=2993314 RepID=UPI00224A557F|nr:MarR family transcriptional regulator [Haladaptatus caseinilyticus]
MVKTGDEDDDQVPNNREIKLGTNVTSEDTDKDGLKDRSEIVDYNTNPKSPDTDNDSLRDAQEIQVGSDPTEPDTDADGLIDGQEEQLGTNASAADTDDDGITDAKEINLEPATDPTKNDTDGDGRADAAELESQTDPLEPDTDGDGLNDGDEHKYNTDPTKVDTDGDGVSDAKEIEIGTDPLNEDTDDDGLDDGLEYHFGTNPNSPIIAGGLYLVLLSFLVGCAVLIQRNGVHWFSDLFRDNNQKQTQQSGTKKSNEVVTDADRVLSLLRENGGRLPQGQFIEETGWSKSKVSRLLSKMEDQKKISKINIGRKNIVIIYGQEPNNMAHSENEDK